MKNKRVEKAVVVVPVHTRSLNEYEKVTIKQIFSVLGKYPICFVLPQSFDDISYLKKLEKCEFFIEHFPDSFFSSAADYSRLCLEMDFYLRFSKYEYMLIHQLDAFVFEDKLTDFAGLGYDYIGAPLCNDTYWKKYHVGNGGLSLRKVSSCIEMLKHKEEILEKTGQPQIVLDYEDHFWSFCGYDCETNFKVPGVDIASKFALQDDSCDIYKLIPQRGLPFGIHMWWGDEFAFWRPIIEAYGYSFPNKKQEPYINRHYGIRARKHFDNWLKDYTQADAMELLQYMNISLEEPYVIWGNGNWGRILVAFLLWVGVKVERIIDNNKEIPESYLNIPVSNPDPAFFKNATIIIAMKNGAEDVLEQIRSYNVISESRILSCYDLEKGTEQYLEKKYEDLVSHSLLSQRCIDKVNHMRASDAKR